MNPILLQKQIRDNASDLQDYYKDLKQWGEEMKRKEQSLKSTQEDDADQLPHARNKVKKTLSNIPPGKPKTSNKRKGKYKSYTDWEKFDVEAECAKLDKEDANSSDPESDLTDEFDESTKDEAIYEKEKGNKFVKSQSWTSAIECYTKAIGLYAYDPVFYANRALCYLKTENFKNAEADCTTALQLDKTYVKAYQRRAAAREALGQLSEAHSDLLKVFDYEPNNKESRQALIKLEKKLENIQKPVIPKEKEFQSQRPVSKFTLSRQKQRNKTTVDTDVEEKRPELNINKARVIERKQEVASASTSSNETNCSEQSTFWPSGNDVKIIKSITKPPHLRSKKPLKRIEIKDVESFLPVIEKPTKHVPESQTDVPLKCDSNKVDEKLIEQNTASWQSDALVKQKDANNICAEDVDLQVPKTSVQFITCWKKIKNNEELKFQYLSLIDPNRFSSIFIGSLSSDIFSEILVTLAESFVEKNKSVFEYLNGLTLVKRFSTLVMFMSTNDKNAILKLTDNLKSFNHTKEEINDLLKKYGL